MHKNVIFLINFFFSCTDFVFLVTLSKMVVQCKRVVLEYGPLVFENAEKFLEKTDICTALHACKESTVHSKSLLSELLSLYHGHTSSRMLHLLKIALYWVKNRVIHIWHTTNVMYFILLSLMYWHIIKNVDSYKKCL